MIWAFLMQLSTIAFKFVQFQVHHDIPRPILRLDLTNKSVKH